MENNDQERTLPGHNGGGILKPIPKGQTRNPHGRKKGSKNRATIINQIAKMKVVAKNPSTGEEEKMTMYQAAAIGLFQRAMKGDYRAWQEIQDTLFGKIEQVTTVNLGNMTDEEKRAYLAQALKEALENDSE